MKDSKNCALAPGSRQFGDRLAWFNGHPNQRNAKTAVNASKENRVAVQPGNRTSRKCNSM